MAVNFQFDRPENLFGNDASEDEDGEVFSSYVVYRPEVQKFLDESRPLQVVRAYKGEGKSALLRLVESRLRDKSESPIIIKTTGQAISPSTDSQDSDVWVRAWKQQMLKIVASEIGSLISIAFSDDAMSLVEESERNGFKARSFVSSVVDRLKIKALPVEKIPQSQVAGVEPLLKRWLKSGSNVWVFIDDIDQNFRNEPFQRTKLASCFIAARQLFGQIPELRFRLAVRPNTWAIIKSEFEALSHVEQYMVDLPWSQSMFVDLLARRISGFLERTSQQGMTGIKESLSHGQRYERLIGLVFEDPVPWGGGNRKRPVDVVLHTLSRHRPRWLVELCKVSAESARKNKRAKITLEDIIGQLDAFGNRRVQDLVAEFKPQCAEIENTIVAFSGQNERYRTDELVSLIKRRIIPSASPNIFGKGKVTAPLDVAQFLFQIGFLTARHDSSDGSYEHVAFADRPNLLRTTSNLDEGMTWEIHPVFRVTLKLKDVASKSEIRRGR